MIYSSYMTSPINSYAARKSTLDYNWVQQYSLQLHKIPQSQRQQCIHTSQRKDSTFSEALLPLEICYDSRNANDWIEQTIHQHSRLEDNLVQDNGSVCNPLTHSCDLGCGSEVINIPRENMKCSDRWNQYGFPSSRNYTCDNTTYDKVR